MTPGSSEWRAANWPSCERAELVTREFGPQRIKLRVARAAAEAVEALFDVFSRRAYVVRQKVTGAYNCRKITGGSVPSAHASGIAIDVNWDTNPYVKGRLVTDVPDAVVADVAAIRTRAGQRVWRWGGDWDSRPDTPHKFYDAMHWELIVTKQQLASGIERAVVSQGPAARPVLRHGAVGAAVVELQQRLTAEGYKVPTTGNFLDMTARQVRAYQRERGLKPDGIVGPATWTALIHSMPRLASGDIKPGKGERA